MVETATAGVNLRAAMEDNCYAIFANDIIEGVANDYIERIADMVANESVENTLHRNADILSSEEDEVIEVPANTYRDSNTKHCS